MQPGPLVLAVHLSLVALPLGDDVVLGQVLLGRFAKGFFGLDFTGAEFSAQLDTLLSRLRSGPTRT